MVLPDQLEMERHENLNRTWVPDTPPSLDGIDTVFFDTETKGLDWWDGRDLLVGLAVGTSDGRSWYLPIRHKGGGNLDESTFHRWASTELKGKRLIGANTKFDIQVMRNFDVDLEEMGCEVSDVQHYAALLDDHRRTFNLEELGQEFLGCGKIKDLDKNRMAEYHAGEVDSYAKRDIKLTAELHDHFWKGMRAQGLEEVSALEDRVIWPVCEMERNACHLDRGLLTEWVDLCEQEILRAQWKIQRETGMRINPKSPKDMERLFDSLSLPIEHRTKKTGQGSFTADILKKIDHPVIKILTRLAQLKSIESKYLTSYQKRLTADDRLRFNLHQLRSDDGGTVSGRFSSSDTNIQNVFNPSRQREKMGGDEFIIRQLFVPGEGQWFSADAMQIEFRLVAHYAQPPAVMAAYEADPLVSFHKIVWKMVSELAEISYKALKDLNFAKVYGAAWKKCTIMMGLNIKIPEEKALGKKFVEAYDERFPEIRDLLQQASDVAENRGFVKTLSGRRARFPRGWKLHSALNRIVQGGAGDIMKKKMCEVHEERKRTGFKMRFTVHDELDGDCPDDESARMVEEILNRQTTDLRIPILWEVQTGENWAVCS